MKAYQAGNPTKVDNLKDIRYLSGGKNNQAVIDKQGEVYICGQNSYGELGKGTKTNVDRFEKLSTIDEVIDIDEGNTYTIMLKRDGTVWGSGDYSHGDEEVKSKTKSSYPVQVGNDETGLNETEIVVEVGKEKDITANCAYAFNLIYESQNFKDELEYEVLNSEIGTVDETGKVQGKRVGTTRVNAVSKTEGKIYSILVKVVEEGFQVAPKIEGGENFAAVLKADGSIWSFGYNGDRKTGNSEAI